MEVREGTKVSWDGMNMCVSVCAYVMCEVWECKMHDMSVCVCDMCCICDMMCVWCMVCDLWCLCVIM